jgi:spore germination cell wall hydrolase CwlJ-like protein
MTRDELRDVLTGPQAVLCTILGEAGGESIEGQVAVGQVIANRARFPRWWGGNWRSVCFAPRQFSCWWEGDHANTRMVYAVATAIATHQPISEPTLLSQLRWVTTGVMDEQLLDPTKSADHYLTVALWRSPQCPDWAKHATPTIVCGNHAFFRLEL